MFKLMFKKKVKNTDFFDADIASVMASKARRTLLKNKIDTLSDEQIIAIEGYVNSLKKEERVSVTH